MSIMRAQIGTIAVGLFFLFSSSVFAAGGVTIKNFTATQLHANYDDSPHRYQLAVSTEAGRSPFTYSWRIDCGRLVGSPNSSTVEWQYDKPGECAEATVAFAVLDANGAGQALTQKVFYDETRSITDIKKTESKKEETSIVMQETQEQKSENKSPRLKNIVVTKLPSTQEGIERFELMIDGDNLENKDFWFGWNTAYCLKTEGSFNGFGFRKIIVQYNKADNCDKPFVEVKLIPGDGFNQVLSQDIFDMNGEPSFFQAQPFYPIGKSKYQVLLKKMEVMSEEDCKKSQKDYEDEINRYRSGIGGSFRLAAVRSVNRLHGHIFAWAYRSFGRETAKTIGNLVPSVDTNRLYEFYEAAVLCIQKFNPGAKYLMQPYEVLHFDPQYEGDRLENYWSSTGVKG